MRAGFTFLLVILLLSNALIAQQQIRLNNNWEFLKKDVGTVYETIRPILIKDGPENYPIWEKVNLPHCFNARDAVDPDGNYYQGPGWYRTQLNINNPYK